MKAKTPLNRRKITLRILVFLIPIAFGKVGNGSLPKSLISNGKVMAEVNKKIMKNHAK